MRIAIIGSGVSGLVCAHELHREHEITVFEADRRIGGHVNTVMVRDGGVDLPVDTGFIVFNHRNYPGFTALLTQLGVASHASRMSFSVRDDRGGVEYGGATLNGVFAQRRNLLRPAFHRMLRDITRFGREAVDAAHRRDEDATLGEYLREAGYSREFQDHYLVPMASAIWSSSSRQVRAFPLGFFVRFFDNHGMLTPRRAPEWRVVTGGSRVYVEALVAPFRERVRCATPVDGVRREGGGVAVATRGGDAELFDEAIIAVHSDQALRMLRDATELERSVLGSFAYQPSEAVLHTDVSLLPRRRRAWAAWNYAAPRGPADDAPVSVTYNQTILQSLPTSTAYCVSLNSTERIDPARVIARFSYHHPVYSFEAIRAQARHAEISGTPEGRVHFCGAYWGNGFHEDGVQSALRVCRAVRARTGVVV